MYTFVISSPFVEHPVMDIAQFDAHEYDICIFDDSQSSNFINKGQFNLEQYCKCLLNKLFTLPKSKVKPFLQYQCDRLQEPIVWLNKLEKLIDLNRELFTDKEQIIKFEKTLMLIELMRDAIEQYSQVINDPYNFEVLKNKVKQYSTYEEKLNCLMEAKTEYLQNLPAVIDINETPFNEKVDLEIDLIKSQQKLSKKAKVVEGQEQKSPTGPKTKIKSPTDENRNPVGLFQFNCQTNVFVDIFFQLTKEITAEGKPILDAGFNDLANFIANNFKDKNGKELSLSTVKTILNTSRPEKRPSQEKRIKLKVKGLSN